MNCCFLIHRLMALKESKMDLHSCIISITLCTCTEGVNQVYAQTAIVQSGRSKSMTIVPKIDALHPHHTKIIKAIVKQSTPETIWQLRAATHFRANAPKPCKKKLIPQQVKVITTLQLITTSHYLLIFCLFKIRNNSQCIKVLSAALTLSEHFSRIFRNWPINYGPILG